MSANIQVVQDMLRQQRTMRRPKHPFYITHKPFAIQPFMIAPVLPGETMQNMLLQARAVTDPVKNKLIGWWQEYYIFYCKHRDLPGRADFEAMMLDPDKDMSAYDPATTKAKHYSYTSQGIDWVGQCLQRVVEEFFRDEGEAWDNVLIDGLPAAAVHHKTGLESAIKSASLPEGDTIAADTSIQDIDQSYMAWFQLMQEGLTDMTYEDFLKQYGVRGRLVEEGSHKPELIRYVKDWSYPSNTIDPTDGSAVSALSWSVAERADKKRFFPEPGFIFGVTVTRPKIYFQKQVGALSQWLSSARDWMPPILHDKVWSSLKEFDDAAGPLSGNTGGAGQDYWVDMRDLFMYGDQFVSDSISAGTGAQNDIALPDTNLNMVYPSEAMVDTLFVTGGSEYTRQDGVASLTIAGRQKDHT